MGHDAIRGTGRTVLAMVLAAVALWQLDVRGRERTVSNASDLDAALKTGGTIVLAPGTYTGNFVVTVEGTVLRGVSLAADRRVAPDDVASVVLTPADQSKPTLRVKANRVTVDGLTVRNPAPDRLTVQVGTSAATSVDEQPHDVTLDHLAVLAGEAGGLRGIALHGVGLTVRNSYIANFWMRGRDSQAIWVSNGPGPYSIVNNYLEASGENILFGGDTVRIKGTVPSDIVVRGNTLMKPPSWREKRGSVKNSLEFKNGQRAIVEDNVIDGNWKDAQDGSTIVLTVRNQYGDCPWCTVDDITLRRNVVRNAADGWVVNVLGHDNHGESGQMKKLAIESNLFADARNGIRVGRGVSEQLVVRRNTFPAIRWAFLNFNGTGPGGAPLVKTPLAFEENVTRCGEYGISGENTPLGTPTLEAFTTALSFRNNLIERSEIRNIPLPSGNRVLPPGGLAKLLDPQTMRLRTGDAGY